MITNRERLKASLRLLLVVGNISLAVICLTGRTASPPQNQTVILDHESIDNDERAKRATDSDCKAHNRDPLSPAPQALIPMDAWPLGLTPQT